MCFDFCFGLDVLDFCSRSNSSHMFSKIDILKNSAIFTGKHLCWSIFLMKLQVWWLYSEVFSSEYCGIFKNTFLWNASGGCFRYWKFQGLIIFNFWVVLLFILMVCLYFHSGSLFLMKRNSIETIETQNWLNIFFCLNICAPWLQLPNYFRIQNVYNSLKNFRQIQNKSNNKQVIHTKQ